MFRNFLKIAIRNLIKNKVFSSINVVGLSLALASSLLLFLTAYFELSFDRFHENGDHVYRVIRTISQSNLMNAMGSNLPLPLGPTLQKEYPHIEHTTRWFLNGGSIQYRDKKIDENIAYVDPEFLQIFTFPLLKGDPRTALNDPGNVILKEDVAKSVFGDEDPIGKSVTLSFNGETKTFIVSAVISNPPKNSELTYSLLTRIENSVYYTTSKDHWDHSFVNTYVQLANEQSNIDFEKKLRPFAHKYFADQIHEMKTEGVKPDNDGEWIKFQLQPLTDIHFNGMLQEGNAYIYPYTLLTISILILIIASVNFVNLSVARSLTRTREVGMRKVLGASKWHIIRQFWGEAFFICVFSFGLGILLAALILPEYKTAFRTEITFDILKNPWVQLSFMGFFVIALVAGGYPAWFISQFHTLQILKGKISAGRSNPIRNGLIVIQFTLATLLIISTILIGDQIRFLRNMPLGFDTKQVISIPVHGNGKAVLQRLRNELASESSILYITAASNNFGIGKDGSSSKSVATFSYKNKSISANLQSVDYDFIKTMGLQLKGGRDFSRDYTTDSTTSVLINETMAQQLGELNPIGKLLDLQSNNKPVRVIGLLKDFHFESLRNHIESVMITLGNKDFEGGYIFVKIQSQSVPETMALLEKTWKKVAPEKEFQGSFVDENTGRQYKREERIAGIFNTAAGLAILLSCMGLFAIAVMVITQRTKEVGIRKVLGASVGQLVVLLSCDFLKLVIIAFVLSIPVAWYAANQWLQDFAYHTEVSWWVFALAGVIAILIALLTVSLQAIRTALANPVKSLQNE